MSRGSKLSQILSKNLPEAIGSFTRTGKSFEKFHNPGTRGSFHSEHRKKQKQRFFYQQDLKNPEPEVFDKIKEPSNNSGENHTPGFNKTKQNKTREI